MNIGPNLTYAGSLATLLWRRIVHRHEHDVDLGEFTRLGLLATPAALVGAVADATSLRVGLLIVPVAGVIIVVAASVLSPRSTPGASAPTR